jgi:hypothetical protein
VLLAVMSEVDLRFCVDRIDGGPPDHGRSDWPAVPSTARACSFPSSVLYPTIARHSLRTSWEHPARAERSLRIRSLAKLICSLAHSPASYPGASQFCLTA